MVRDKSVYDNDDDKLRTLSELYVAEVPNKQIDTKSLKAAIEKNVGMPGFT